MKRLFSMAALVALTAGGAATQASAATATAALDANSAYVWRGLTFNDGFVLQPSMDVSANGFAFNVWANYDLDDYDNAVDDNEFSEVDLTGSYAFKLGNVDTRVGIIHYIFPTTDATAAGADSSTTVGACRASAASVKRCNVRSIRFGGAARACASGSKRAWLAASFSP